MTVKGLTTMNSYTFRRGRVGRGRFCVAAFMHHIYIHFHSFIHHGRDALTQVCLAGAAVQPQPEQCHQHGGHRDDESGTAHLSPDGGRVRHRQPAH